MPHKHNPVGSVVALAAATRVPGLVATMLSATVMEHERGVGGWHAEWETLAEIVTLTAGSLNHMIDVVSGLQINAETMMQNMRQMQGQIMVESVTMAIAEHLGRGSAQAIVEEVCARASADGIELRAALANDGRVTQLLAIADIDRLLNPRNYLGASSSIIDRILTSWHENK
jgi:3-carboxy-cis,cis-muconate cycloisomerase